MEVVTIIPVFNRATIIPATLESVAAQTVPPRQVVVVDDESTDGTAEATERWFSRSPRPFKWKVVRAQHALAGGARNRGIREADDSELVHFLDSDDLIPPDFLERAIAGLRARPEAIAASADQFYTGRLGETIRSRSLEEIAKNPSRWLAFNDGGILSNTVLRREVFDRFGPFPEHVRHGDNSHVLFPASKNSVWIHLPGQPIEFRTLGDNLSTPAPDLWRSWTLEAEEKLPMLGLSRRDLTWTLSRRWVRTGRSFRDDGQFAEARRCYLRALRHRPLYATAYRRLFEIFGRRPVSID